MKHTWGSHCDKLIFMSTEEDKELGAIKLDVEEGRQGLWGKTKLGFKHVYENYFDQFDWFMKADDDTFVIVENLKFLLAHYSTMDPLSFGHHFKVLGVRKHFTLEINYLNQSSNDRNTFPEVQAMFYQKKH